MLEWVKKILIPFIAIAPENVIPLLVLDSYPCHMMALIIVSIQQLFIKVEHIPGGHISICQHVDIGIIRSMKAKISIDLNDWMLGSGISVFTTRPPT